MSSQMWTLDYGRRWSGTERADKLLTVGYVSQMRGPGVLSARERFQSGTLCIVRVRFLLRTLNTTEQQLYSPSTVMFLQAAASEVYIRQRVPVHRVTTIYLL